MCSGKAVKQLMCWRVSAALNAAKLERKAVRGVRELESNRRKKTGGRRWKSKREKKR